MITISGSVLEKKIGHIIVSYKLPYEKVADFST